MFSPRFHDAKIMSKSTVLWLVLSFSMCQPQLEPEGKSLEELVDLIRTNVSSTTTTSKPPLTSTGVNLEPHDADGGKSECECVQYYQCDNGTLNVFGKWVIDVRLGVSECKDTFKVCCKHKEIVPKPRTPKPDGKKPTGCGYRNADGVGFRITGNSKGEAEFGEFPWMVAVLTEKEKTDIYKCGGSLIHPQVVLTSAHCVADESKKYKIRAGEWDTKTTNELLPSQTRNVGRIVSHPKYNSGALLNDIALLFLDSAVELAENVNVICLPSQDLVVDQARCFATGWGKEVFNKKDELQVILKKIDLPMVPRAKCEASLRTTRLGKFFELHESFVCAGGETGKDACKGDGGGPLVCPIAGADDVYQQVGIVAWGIGCGDTGIPGVYANVAMFRKWIDEHLASQNYDTSVYEYKTLPKK